MRSSYRNTVLACTMAFAGLLATAEAKTLVYCSEGSPENFNPMLNTTGTTFDANEPIYNRLVEFRPGSTEVSPALAERWEIGEDGKSFTFHLRQGVKWQSNKTFKPSRDFNADDVMFSFERQWKDANPYHKVSGGGYDYFSDMSFNKLLASIDVLDDDTVRFTLNAPQAPFLSDLAMDFASIQSKEYADALLKQGKPELIDQEPIGTGPFELVQYQRDSTIRYRALRRLLGTEAEARCAGVLDQQGPRGAAGQAARQRVPGDGISQSGRPAGDQGRSGAATDAAAGAEHRLSGVQQPEAAVHRQAACASPSTWRSTSRRSCRRCIRAPASRRRT